MSDVPAKLATLRTELEGLIAELRVFKHLYPYEREYVLRGSYEIIQEYKGLTGQLLTITK